jgi:hypothetical protein
MNIKNEFSDSSSLKKNWINRHPIITIIGLLILISPIISALSGGGSSSTTAPSSATSTETTSLNIGDVGYVKSPTGSTFVSSTKDVEDRVMQLSIAKDTDGLMQMVLTGDPLLVDDGTQVRVIGAGFTSIEVRITNGKYYGQSGWVLTEFVSSVAPTTPVKPTTKTKSPSPKTTAPVIQNEPTQVSTASWHTAYTYSNNVDIKTPQFAMKGSKWRVTYSCTTNPDALAEGIGGMFYGHIYSADTGVEATNFASFVYCPRNDTSYVYAQTPGQYYLDLSAPSSSYNVTVEDYY